jgi:predicted amidohydrolase YtcJ
MDQVVDAIEWAFANGIQIMTHANGEGASDMLIAAVEAAQPKHGSADRRTVLIHGQFLREDEVDAIRRLDVFPSLYPDAHLLRGRLASRPYRRAGAGRRHLAPRAG